jgi:hypothetical protein
MSTGLVILLLCLIPALWKRSSLFALIWVLGSGILAWEYASFLFGRKVFDYILILQDPIGAMRIAPNRSQLFGRIFGWFAPGMIRPSLL